MLEDTQSYKDKFLKYWEDLGRGINDEWNNAIIGRLQPHTNLEFRRRGTAYADDYFENHPEEDNSDDYHKIKDELLAHWYIDNVSEDVFRKAFLGLKRDFDPQYKQEHKEASKEFSTEIRKSKIAAYEACEFLLDFATDELRRNFAFMEEDAPSEKRLLGWLIKELDPSILKEATEALKEMREIN